MAVAAGVVAARFLPDQWDPWIYIGGGGLLAAVGIIKAKHSTAQLFGFLFVGAGVAMFGLGHLVNLSSASELMAAAGLIAFGLVLIVSDRGQTDAGA